MAGPGRAQSHGFVLAGGRSSRMGRDKALLAVDASPMLRVIAARVEAVAGGVTVIADSGRYASLGLEVVPDLRPGLGPLSGIETALSLRRAEFNLIVACDMPNVSTQTLAALLRTIESSPADCIVSTSSIGRLEPLCAVYHRRSLRAVQQALNTGRGKVTEMLESLQVLHFAIENKEEMANLNSPEDWLAFLGARRG